MYRVSSAFRKKPGQKIVFSYFTNILLAAFSYGNFVRSFFCAYTLGLNFLAQEYWCKGAHKMLVKLTIGLLDSKIIDLRKPGILNSHKKDTF